MSLIHFLNNRTIGSKPSKGSLNLNMDFTIDKFCVSNVFTFKDENDVRIKI